MVEAYVRVGSRTNAWVVPCGASDKNRPTFDVSFSFLRVFLAFFLLAQQTRRKRVALGGELRHVRFSWTSVPSVTGQSSYLRYQIEDGSMSWRRERKNSSSKKRKEPRIIWQIAALIIRGIAKLLVGEIVGSLNVKCC